MFFIALLLPAYADGRGHKRFGKEINWIDVSIARCVLPARTYFCFSDADGLSEIDFTIISKSSSALGEEEDVVMQGGLEGFVGNLKKEPENNSPWTPRLPMVIPWGYPDPQCMFYVLVFGSRSQLNVWAKRVFVGPLIGAVEENNRMFWSRQDITQSIL